MPKLPAVTGQEAIKAFGKLGFRLDRTGGSHHVLVKDDHLYHLTVPVHGHRSLAKGTLRALIRASGVSVEEFVQLL